MREAARAAGCARGAPPVLSRDDVQVWAARLDAPDPGRRRLRSLLSEEESHRADELHGEQRRRFVVRRGLLRTILAGHLGRDPSSLELARGPWGKPELAGGELEFSCSSSGELALYAVALGRRVGVDVERLRPVLEPLETARSSLPPTVHERLALLPGPRRHEAFLRLWTRHEAVLKARGDGLARALDPSADRPSRQGGHAWFVRRLVPAAGYVGAVAAEGTHPRVTCRRW